MRISVVVVGRLRGPLESATQEYEMRASRYWKLDLVEVEAGAQSSEHTDARQVRSAEAKRLLGRTPEGFETWALTRTGAALSSRSFAEALAANALKASRGVTFLVGGAYGLDPAILQGVTRQLSLSAMTLPHGMARLLLAEQLYRAGTILRNEPYHKGGS